MSGFSLTWQNSSYKEFVEGKMQRLNVVPVFVHIQGAMARENNIFFPLISLSSPYSKHLIA